MVIVLAFEYTNDYPSSSTATWKSAGKVRSYASETYPQLEKNGTKLTVQFYNDSNSDVTYYYRLYYMIID